MKKLVLCLILLLAIMIPLACGNQNNSPNGPIGGGTTPVPTKTNTPGGPTSTPTNTITPTTSGYTPTVTITPATYDNTIGTSGAPQCMVITGARMDLGERGNYSAIESFNIGAGGTAAVAGIGGAVLQGIPTPNVTPGAPLWAPVTTNLVGPQGYVFNGSNSAVLDVASSGSATLYEGNNSELAWVGNAGEAIPALGSAYQPVEVSGYGIYAFSNPKSLATDSNGVLYVADTGTGSVDVFDGKGGPNFPQAGFHQLWGNAGTFTVGLNTFTGVNFKSPYAVTTDSSNNLWVTDTGYTPSYVQAFANSGIPSFGVSIVMAFQTIPGCVATGIAVPTVGKYAGMVCIADSGNNQVEIYSATGTILGILTDPHSNYEGGKLFQPSCIGFDNANNILWVADTANDNIISFTPN
jgi:sugar lactone lactonase YvrE